MALEEVSAEELQMLTTYGRPEIVTSVAILPEMSDTVSKPVDGDAPICKTYCLSTCPERPRYNPCHSNQNRRDSS